MNEVLDCMGSHHSVRAFTSEPVDEGFFLEAVGAAQRAATSSNMQGYSLLRVRDSATRARLAELCGDQVQVREAALFLIVAGDARRHALVAEREGRPHRANLETFLLAVIDAALFAQNLALALESGGLGTCFIGALRNRLPEVDQLLELPRLVFPLFGLCVGHAGATESEQAPVRPRLPLEAVLHEERYTSDEALVATIEQHDAEMSRYYTDRGHPGRNWSGSVARRFQQLARGDLREYYEGKGAVLG